MKQSARTVKSGLASSPTVESALFMFVPRLTTGRAHKGIRYREAIYWGKVGLALGPGGARSIGDDLQKPTYV